MSDDSKKYICPRCNYSSAQKSNIVQHLKSKKPCETKYSNLTREDVLRDYQRPPPKLQQVLCQWCNKTVTKVNHKRHQGMCSRRPTLSYIIQEDNDTLEYTNVIKDAPQQSLINTIVQETCKEFVKLLTSSIMVAPNITNNQFNSVTININSHGEENLSYITHEFLSHCLLNPTKGITSLIDTIHYNEGMPMNHNLRYKSSKHNTFEKYMGYQWLECDASNTLDELIKKGYRVLNSHYTEFFLHDPEYQDDDIKREAIEKFRFLSDKSSNEYYSVKRELRLLIKNKTVYVMAPPQVGENIEL